MPEKVDIERLCQWAYRDELAKRQTSSAEAVWARIAEWTMFGSVIDRGDAGPQRYDLGSPDPDALLLEQAVSKLPDIALDWQREAPMILGDLLALIDPRPRETQPATSPGSTARWTDRQGKIVATHVKPARDVILVRTLRPAALVTAHASAGTRPDWKTDIPKPQWVPSVRGHGPKIYGECKGKNYYTPGSYCPLAWAPSPLDIAEARADYLAWWRALALLTRQLTGRLVRYTPLAPAAPEMPWRLTLGANH